MRECGGTAQGFGAGGKGRVPFLQPKACAIHRKGAMASL